MRDSPQSASAVTDETRARVREIILQGLVSGLGDPEPGKLCIEAAICLAMGEKHGDMPPCVAEPDRQFAIGINDASWSSPEARAEALLPLALAQLGTAGTDRTAWARALAIGTIRRVLPLALRAAASVHPDAAHRDALEAAAGKCEEVAPDAAADATYAAAADADAAYAAARVAIAAAGHAADAATAAAAVSSAAARIAAAARDGTMVRDDVLREAVAVALDAYRATDAARA